MTAKSRGPWIVSYYKGSPVPDLAAPANTPIPDLCPRCAAWSYGAGVGENDDGTTFIYCSCGYVYDGEDKG
jgi:hypothetical protein